MAALKVTTATSVLLHVILMCGITTTAAQSTVLCSDINCAVGACNSNRCTRCRSGFYLGATACQQCAPASCNSPTEYTAQQCDGVFNRLCKTCSGDCPAGKFRSALCTATRDRVCTACGCPENMFVGDITACDSAATANFICNPCADCEAKSPQSYAATPCGVASDAQCVQCSGGCEKGFYVSTPCTATADRTCAACTACPKGTFEGGGCDGIVDTRCTPCKKCDATEYISVPCDFDSDTICLSCEPCANGQNFEISPCDGINNRQCKGCTVACSAGYYESSACNVTTDLQCTACGCPDGMFETAGTSCSGSANVDCTSCKQCNNVTEYVLKPCQSGTDTECRKCDAPCDNGQYEITSCNGVTNRKCAACDPPCDDGQYEATPCNRVTNRRCAACTDCPSGSYKTADCTETKNTACAPCDECKDGKYETGPCTGGLNNRQCAEPTTPKPTLLQLCKTKFAQGGSVGLRCKKVLCQNVKSLRRSGFCGNTQPGFRPPIGRSGIGRPRFG